MFKYGKHDTLRAVPCAIRCNQKALFANDPAEIRFSSKLSLQNPSANGSNPVKKSFNETFNDFFNNRVIRWDSPSAL